MTYTEHSPYFQFTKMHLITPSWVTYGVTVVNTLRPRQNGRHFAEDIFKCIFLNENVWISINISMKFVPKGPINNIPALVQIMAWRHPGDKPLSERMMVSLTMHICVTRPWWVNGPFMDIYMSSSDDVIQHDQQDFKKFHSIWSVYI